MALLLFQRRTTERVITISEPRSLVLEQSNNLLYRGDRIAEDPNFLYSRQEGPDLCLTDVSSITFAATD